MYAVLVGIIWIGIAAALDMPAMLKQKSKKDLAAFVVFSLAGLMLHAAHGFKLPFPSPLEFVRLFAIGGK